jgi:hypothetical protein
MDDSNNGKVCPIVNMLKKIKIGGVNTFRIELFIFVLQIENHKKNTGDDEKHVSFIGFMPGFACRMQACRPASFPYRESLDTRVDALARAD